MQVNRKITIVIKANNIRIIVNLSVVPKSKLKKTYNNEILKVIKGTFNSK